jgi:pyruvate/2-oxoglutarate dehydrogenase complex dihydrolipoamide dehydrogenase (E3) component
LADVRRAPQFGVNSLGAAAIDFGAAMERMRRLRAEISRNDSVQRFRELGVDVFLGPARFAGPDRLMVGDSELRFRRAILATGTRPTTPDIPGLEEAGHLTNESIFALKTLPARLAVIGAGPIGCELAQAFARFGSRVTLIGNHGQLLPREDGDAAALVARQFEADGVEVLLDSRVERVIAQGESKSLTVKQGDKSRALAADAILVAVGRTPNVEHLGLEEAGVAFDARDGVQVTDRLQTSNGRIFAAGDICSRFQFTHAADALARIAVRNALFYGRRKASALVIPWCTYTDPEVAHVGLSEAAAGQQGVAIQTFVQEFRHIDRALLDGEGEGFVKIHVRAGADRIVGATIVGAHAGLMIGTVSLAMTGGLRLRTLSDTIFPYPTHGEAFRKIGDAYQKTRLTPTVRWLFDQWFRWTG